MTSSSHAHAHAHAHTTCVVAWRRRVARDGSAAALLRSFERSFRAVWRRAHVTLGDVTLTAIGDRILHDATDVYPMLAAVRLEPTGISCEDLERDAAEPGHLDPEDLDDAVETVLVDFLTVVGRLTGDVLTPALHAELDADCDDDEGSGP